MSLFVQASVHQLLIVEGQRNERITDIATVIPIKLAAFGSFGSESAMGDVQGKAEARPGDQTRNFEVLWLRRRGRGSKTQSV